MYYTAVKAIQKHEQHYLISYEKSTENNEDEQMVFRLKFINKKKC